MSRKIPQSVFGRAGRLLLTGAKIAASEAVGRLSGGDSELATRIRQTQELVTTLSQLKGAAMKAGQLLSLEFSDLLPPEVTEILRQLHDSGENGTFMPFDQVRYILTRELGADRLSRLEDLTPSPIAAASIGQVHRATLDGRAVVVKVQFPGVAKSIDADLAVVRRIAGMFLQIQGKTIALDALFAELAEGLKKEADYRLEAVNVELYRKTLRNPAFVVPHVVPDFSTERVLTLSFEEGQRLSDWLKSRPAPDAVRAFSGEVIALLIEEFFANGLVQTDPNYGNFLYRPKDGRIVLLDFGATNVYPAEFRREIRDLMSCAVEGDEARMVELTHRYGLLDVRESAETVALYREMMKLVAYPFRPERQPFRFMNEQYLKDIRDVSFRFVASVRHSAPAKQIIFLNRKLGGMFHLLKDLDAELDMAAYYKLAVAAEILPDRQ